MVKAPVSADLDGGQRVATAPRILVHGRDRYGEELRDLRCGEQRLVEPDRRLYGSGYAAGLHMRARRARCLFAAVALVT